MTIQMNVTNFVPLLTYLLIMEAKSDSLDFRFVGRILIKLLSCRAKVNEHDVFFRIEDKIVDT